MFLILTIVIPITITMILSLEILLISVANLCTLKEGVHSCYVQETKLVKPFQCFVSLFHT